MKINEEEIKKMVSSLADRLYTYTHFLTEFCLKVMDEQDFHVKEKHFFYTLLFKASNELTAVGVLFKNFYEKAALQGGMYLILRTVMSDSLTGWHVLQMRKNGEDFLQMIDLIHFDHVSFAIKSTKGSFNLIHKLPHLELEKKIQLLKANFPAFFEYNVDENGETVYGNDIFKGKFYSLKGTIKYLAQQKLDDEEERMFTHLIYYYDFFSKFEHPGALTFRLVHRSFDPGQQENSLVEVVEALFAIEPILYEYMSEWPHLLEDSAEFDKASKNYYTEARSLIAAIRMEAIKKQ